MKHCIVLLAFAAGLHAQNTGMAFQNVNKLTILPDPPAITLASALRDEIAGRPVSAIEERHTLQILSDGTRIETRSSDKYYRDDQGRTRIEREDGAILISDPILGAGAEIKNGNVVQRATGYKNPPRAPNNDLAVVRAKLMVEAELAMAKASAASNSTSVEAKLRAEAAMKKGLEDEENLGLQSVNGVLAQGTRSVTTIPLGMIGNDRPIEIVNERWVSAELQMTIKSSNKDPRFGETTYELTNIQLGQPDPSLFVIPPGK